MISNIRQPCDEGLVRSQPDVTECTRATGRWVLAVAILGSSITFIDGTVVNVALPLLQKELRASVAGAQWIVESYALMLASLILVGGSLGDRLGRKRVFAAGVVVFALASVWCGLAGGSDMVNLRIPDSIDVRTQGTVREMIRESFVAGFRLVAWIAALLAFAAALASWLMIEGKEDGQAEITNP